MTVDSTSSPQEAVHTPVLLEEVMEFLKVVPGGRYVDATVGEGGHALEIARRGGKVLGIDRDPEILEQASRQLGKKAVLVRGNFKDIDQIAQENGFTEADGILFDLGISSWHLLSSGRGFSFQRDEPLDMRADPSLSVTAADLLNGLTNDELEKLFQKFGEEKRAVQLAAAVVRARSVRPFETTGELVRVVEGTRGNRGKIPARSASAQRWRARHPATRIFQALRIAVNDEIGNLRSVLPRAFEVLKTGGRRLEALPGGRLVVVSFHSLEDREVKNFFRRMERSERGVILTKKPLRPPTVEVSQNPQARSARLRAMERK
ncbi:MAG: 16S rRNA (cytosine(1402)-N(4))-methyltransferase RsmH [candidate division WWE3 bacterium]|nr:16S rRNA (cytosine(1402)-N(4))-methyltransferase RsmH [candidate division WWE3 bacterium]